MRVFERMRTGRKQVAPTTQTCEDEGSAEVRRADEFPATEAARWSGLAPRSGMCAELASVVPGV